MSRIIFSLTISNISNNKMISNEGTLTTEHSAPLSAHINQLEHSAFPLLYKRLHEVKRANSQHKSMKAKIREKVIKEENDRLYAKLIEIRQRKFKMRSNKGPISIRKRQNPQRERTISLENQRLGRSLVLIKTGQHVERVKTEMTKSAIKSSKSKRETEPSQYSKHNNLFYEGHLQRKQSISSSFTQGKKERCINIDLLIELRNKER